MVAITSETLMRAAAVVTVLYSAGHSAGYPWTPAIEMSAKRVVDDMRSVWFDALGEQRTYWDFYIGFGLTISMLMLFQGITLWLVSPLASTEPKIFHRVALANALCYLGNMYICWKHFFLPPLLFAVTLTCLLFYLSIPTSASKRDVKKA